MKNSLFATLKTSKGYTLQHVAGNMFKVVKLGQAWLSPEDRVYVQKSAHTFPYMVDAGSQDPCYWLGEVTESSSD